MRANKYLYIVPLGDNAHVVVFNGITKQFLHVRKNAIDSIKKIISNPNLYQQSHPKIIERLTSLGLIVADDFDEVSILISERNCFVEEKEYKTTILPTFECNYNCWYCIQKHSPIKIDYAKINLIIRHIKKYLEEEEIKEYVLSWFGGEPLTQPHIIEYVARELITFCKCNNIVFSSGITTNGALLNDTNIQILKQSNVNYYQITIDGDEKAHNRNKQDKLSDNSFGLILSNIIRLLDYNENANVVLRLNYTLATLNSQELIDDICKYIPYSYRCRIVVDLQKVWQIKEEKVDIAKLRHMQEKFVDNGFRLSINHVFAMCYVEKIHYNMFYYNGGVEKCDKRTIDNLRGHINTNGDIVWDEKPIIHDYPLLDKASICSACKYYPLCYGGCPVLREERIKENKGKLICGYAGDHSIFESRIQDYCWRVIHNQRLKL